MYCCWNPNIISMDLDLGWTSKTTGEGPTLPEYAKQILGLFSGRYLYDQVSLGVFLYKGRKLRKESNEKEKNLYMYV